MESVSPKLKSSGRWEDDIRKFWTALRRMFEIEKSSSCGTHIHIAPWKASYTLKQAQTIAFACCYYERYVISCLPQERRDHSYCQRNSKVATKMGELYEMRTSRGICGIASDIKAVDDFQELIHYMHGGSDAGLRRVLWNFRNLYYGNCTGTIEFRGGRHLRGPNRTIAWITFAQIFVMMALDEVRYSMFEMSSR